MPRKKREKKPPGDKPSGLIAKKGGNSAVPESPPAQEGQLASDIGEEELEWFLQPWLPFKFLAYIVGHPGTGKSTLVATLLAYATSGFAFGREDGHKGRAALLPGAEDPVKISWTKRLREAGVNMGKLLVLNTKRYQLCRDRAHITKLVKDFGARLLCIDPIDGYVDDGINEDQNQGTRPMLEGLQRLAEDTGACVVFTRNPGKDKDNLTPGSRAWRDVPRLVLQCTKDGTVDPRYTFAPWKYQIGPWPKPIRYKLTSDSPDIRQFTFLEEMDHSAQHLAQTNGGPVGRYRLLQACHLIRWYWEKNETPLRSELGLQAKKEGLGEDIISEALYILGIKSVPPAERGQPWQLVRQKGDWPGWLDTTPPAGPPGDVRKGPEQS